MIATLLRLLDEFLFDKARFRRFAERTMIGVRKIFKWRVGGDVSRRIAVTGVIDSQAIPALVGLFVLPFLRFCRLLRKVFLLTQLLKIDLTQFDEQFRKVGFIDFLHVDDVFLRVGVEVSGVKEIVGTTDLYPVQLNRGLVLFDDNRRKIIGLAGVVGNPEGQPVGADVVLVKVLDLILFELVCGLYVDWLVPVEIYDVLADIYFVY